MNYNNEHHAHRREEASPLAGFRVDTKSLAESFGYGVNAIMSAFSAIPATIPLVFVVLANLGVHLCTRLVLRWVISCITARPPKFTVQPDLTAA